MSDPFPTRGIWKKRWWWLVSFAILCGLASLINGNENNRAAQHTGHDNPKNGLDFDPIDRIGPDGRKRGAAVEMEKAVLAPQRAIADGDSTATTEVVDVEVSLSTNVAGSFVSTDADLAQTFTATIVDFNSQVNVEGATNPETEESSTATIRSFENVIVEQTFRGPFVYQVNASSVPIGGLFPLTSDGVGYLPGVLFAEFFRCTINIANSNGRILPKTLLTYYIQDSGLNPARAVNQALLLSERGVPMVVGPMLDDQAIVTSNLYRDESIPLVTYGAGAIQLTNSTIFPTFYRMVPSDETIARAMAETMRLFGWNFIAALFTTDIYGQSGRTALLRQTGRQRIKVTCANSIDPGSTRGLATFADCVASSDANVVVLWMDQLNAANVLSYLYRNATNSGLTFMASDEWAIIQNPQEFNNTLERTGYSFPLSYIKGTLGFLPTIGSLGLFKACMSLVNPSNTDYPAFNEVWEDEFNCQINGTETTPICPEKFEERTFGCKCRGNENLNLLGAPSTLINYVSDSTQLFINTLNTLFTNCQKLQSSFDYCSLEYFNSTTLNDIMSLISFTGLTGAISFNQTKPDRRRNFLDIFQYTNDIAVPRQVGFWNLTGPYISKSLLNFKTSPEYPQSSLVPDDTVFGTSFWNTLVPVLAGLWLLAAIFFMVFFTVFAESRVVRRANLAYMLLLLTGICFICASMIIWSLNQDTFRCTLKSIIGILGFGILTAAITAKCVRLFKVFVNNGTVNPRMTFTEFFIVFSIIAGITVVVAIVYTIGSGQLPESVIVQSQSDNTYVYIACVPSSTSFGDWVVGTFMAIMAIFMLANAFTLFFARRIDTAYKEADFLFLAVLDFLVLMALLIPLYYTVGDRRGSVEQTYLLRSLGILFAIALTFGVVFVPKMVYILRSIKTGQTSQPAGTTGISFTGSGSGTTRGSKYTELSSDSSLGSENSAEFFGKPRFISENVSHHTND